MADDLVKEESKKGGRLGFLRRGAKKGESAVATNAETAAKKPKKFRRIHGLLTGESRRERRAKKEAARAAAVAAGGAPPVTKDAAEEEDDVETVYGVNVDNSSVAAAVPKQWLLGPDDDMDAEDDEPSFMTDDDNSLSQRALQVILLLMDPKTRRFELLQLEFDSNKAVVRDVLSQVPHSVTEESLRDQNYIGVCDRTGQELYYSTRLCDVCSGSDILIALPDSVDARECARLARPILHDKNVIEMLRSSGVDTTSLETIEPSIQSPTPKTPTAKKTASPAPRPVVTPRATSAAPAPPVTPRTSSTPPVAVVPAASAPAAARPVPVSAKSAPKKPAPAKSAAAKPAPTKSVAAKPVPAKSAPANAAPAKAAPVPVAPAAVAPASVEASDAPSAVSSPVEEKKKESRGTLFIVLLAAIAIFIQVVHMSVTAPLSPGHSLSPNAFMSKCGYKALLPSCQESSLIMNDDGVLTLYNSDGSVQWEMIGGHCRTLEDGCKEGLVVNDDGSLLIGGKRINAAAIYGDAIFTPWPFTVSPNVRLVKGKK